jgi:hypothetical protein
LVIYFNLPSWTTGFEQMADNNTVYLFPGGLIRLVKAGSGVIDGQNIAWGNSIQVISPYSKFPAKLSGQACEKIADLIENEDEFREFMTLCK